MKELQALREGARLLRVSTTRERNAVLSKLRALLSENETRILEANARDVKKAQGKAPAFLDRLMLNSERLQAMGKSLEEIEILQDPVGEVVEKRTLDNGLEISRVRAPLGVIFMIFESRPNVAIEAFSLAIKTANAIILKGGKESLETLKIFFELVQKSLVHAGLPANAFWGLDTSDRSVVLDLLKQKKYIDVVVPRGGDALIEFVVENSKIPIIKNDRGLCHVYVDETADLKKALAIVKNAKTQRPGVCNSMETILVHAKVAATFLPQAFQEMNTVEWFGCTQTQKILPKVSPATEESFNTEYLDLKMNCKVVASVEEALRHIEQFGSKHSEAIVTESKAKAELFLQNVDAAATYWNASTRFTDGFELGLGGELGISTQKLHVRGPVGLRELTSARWIMRGKGQVRK